MNDADFKTHLVYLKQQAVSAKKWAAAGFPIDDAFDTYPGDLFTAAATPEFILEMIKRLETS